MPDPAVCKGCGAPIIWAVSERGNQIPLDATPERRFVVLTFFSRNHQYLRASMHDTYTSHFAHCLKAAEFRKEKHGNG